MRSYASCWAQHASARIRIDSRNLKQWHGCHYASDHPHHQSIGNSKGIVLPNPALAQIGLEGASNVAMTVEHGAIILRKPAQPARAGWAEAARSLAAQGDDQLVMGEFGNQNDAELAW